MADAAPNRQPVALLPAIGQPATRALLANNVATLNDLTTWRRADLARLHGVGPRAISILGQAMAQAGLAFLG